MLPPIRSLLTGLSLIFALSACGGGASDPAGVISSGGSTTSNTVEVFYTKGPVSGAQAWLIDELGNIVAGPELTAGGAVTFTDVNYRGLVYARLTGGSYTDEATSMIVDLTDSFTIRSGIIDSTGSGSLLLNATPLTEIGFLRAASANTDPVLDLSTVNAFIDEVADEYGLDGIDLTTVTPTRLEDLSGTSANDRYGTVLAAITQQQLDAGNAASAVNLQSYIAANAISVDLAAFTNAVNNLQSNVNTSPYVNNSIIVSINTNSGKRTVISFLVDMGDTYQGSVSLEYIIESDPLTRYASMQSQNSDGIYEGMLALKAGANITHRFIQGINASGITETVPDRCGIVTSAGRMRAVSFSDSDETLLAVPFSSCVPDICAGDAGRSVAISVQGRQILDGSQAIHMKGVNWSPFPIGFGPPEPANRDFFAEAVVQDAQLMADAGINVVRTFGPILNEDVLDELWRHGIYVVMTVFYGFSDTIGTAVLNICAVKDHPAVLTWAVGNEWNYSNLEQSISFNRAVAKVGLIADAIKLNDSSRPVSTVYGELPPTNVIERLGNIDLWGLNIYRGLSFYNLFSQWAGISDAPMYVAEYGVDVYDSRISSENQGVQANILEDLTLEINANASVIGLGVAAGGIAFEFNDEWWKYSGQSSDWSAHDTDTSFTNLGFPDPNVHEEWWGLVDINRVRRQAYFAYQAIAAPVAAP